MAHSKQSLYKSQLPLKIISPLSHSHITRCQGNSARIQVINLFCIGEHQSQNGVRRIKKCEQEKTPFFAQVGVCGICSYYQNVEVT